MRKSTDTIQLRASQHSRIHRYLHVGENRGKKKPRPRPRKTLNEKKNYNLTIPLCLLSSDTESFFLPRRRRADNTARPFTLAILLRKPCLFLRFVLEGWYVRFINYWYLPVFGGVQI
jgi:hypothetical protein